MVVDTSLTYPMTLDSLNKVTRRPDTLLSIEKREKEKLHKYGDLATASNLEFIPAIVDYWGAWGEHIRRFVVEVCKAGCMKSDIAFSVLKEYWTQRISVVIQCYVTDLLIKRCQRLYERSYLSHCESINTDTVLAVHPVF